MKINLSYILFFVIASLLFSCKEKADEISPSISFTQPNAGSVYYYNDIIPVKAVISDDRKLDNVKLSVINTGTQEFLQTINYSPSGNEFALETVLLHNDVYLPSGTYYIRIEATDGENEFTAFREIQLVEAPVQLERIFAIATISSTMFLIDTIGTDGEVYEAGFLSGRYETGAIDDRFHYMTLADSDFGAIFHINIQDFSSNPSLVLPGADVAGFYNCAVNDPFNHEIYFGSDEEQIRNVDRFGNFAIHAQLANGFFAEHLAVTESFLYVHSRNVTNTEQAIHVFNRSTGQFIQSLSIDNEMDVQGIHPLNDEDQLLIAANLDGECLLVKYNNETNALNTVFTLYEQSPCYGIWPGADGRFYVAHSAALVQYNNDIQTVSAGIPVVPFQVRYEKVSGSLYIVENGALRILNSAGNSEIDYFSIPGIKDVFLKYNK